MLKVFLIKLSIKILTPILIVSFLCLPTQTFALGPVIVAEDHSTTGTETMLQSTLGANLQSLQLSLMDALAIKELTLDGIAFGLARTAVQAMVSSLVTWINSGFEGKPAFITDLKGFLGDITDQVVGEAIYGSSLSFLCSPFQLDVKIALATQYNNQSSGYQPQCTLSDVSDNVEGFLSGAFNEGGWDSWFELTQGSTNDPNKAYYEATLAIDAAIRDAQGNTIKELDWGNGFQSFKICSDTDAQSGAVSHCTITTPGTVIAEQLNTALGAGQQELITADEVNEVIGALLAQLAQQAVTGVYGLLGMGGNSTFSDNTYGTSGNSSYLDALAAENPTLNSSSSPSFGTDITKQIQLENDYLAMQRKIVAAITTTESLYAESLTKAAGLPVPCTLPNFPTDIRNWKNTGETAINNSVVLIPTLTEIDRRFQTATTSQAQSDIMNEYLKLYNEGNLVSSTELAQTELILKYRVNEEIADFESRVQTKLNSCIRDADDDD